MNAVQNPFDLITDDKEYASILNIKSKLTMLITQNIRLNNMTQAKAAEKAGISQPRISNLMRGQLDKFSIDSLLTINMMLGATCSVDMQANSGMAIDLYISYGSTK
ncbi:helix-turn-helix domain-containing protein [Pseudomonas sp.]|uniref:helix-turn-helix domain-containing protein n=1 Tax=Pseudomonas sp. TaxID=306 RepID=UPI003FD80296